MLSDAESDSTMLSDAESDSNMLSDAESDANMSTLSNASDDDSSSLASLFRQSIIAEQRLNELRRVVDDIDGPRGDENFLAMLRARVVRDFQEELGGNVPAQVVAQVAAHISDGIVGRERAERAERAALELQVAELYGRDERVELGELDERAMARDSSSFGTSREAERADSPGSSSGTSETTERDSSTSGTSRQAELNRLSSEPSTPSEAERTISPGSRTERTASPSTSGTSATTNRDSSSAAPEAELSPTSSTSREPTSTTQAPPRTFSFGTQPLSTMPHPLAESFPEIETPFSESDGAISDTGRLISSESDLSDLSDEDMTKADRCAAAERREKERKSNRKHMPREYVVSMCRGEVVTKTFYPKRRNRRDRRFRR
ncbi:hypothetical protein CJU89_2628 [Yarrowia sp. B02]|nr:hypothetical protein CJU89_2628 [Yarrowia sp. B02]